MNHYVALSDPITRGLKAGSSRIIVSGKKAAIGLKLINKGTERVELSDGLSCTV